MPELVNDKPTGKMIETTFYSNLEMPKWEADKVRGSLNLNIWTWVLLHIVVTTFLNLYTSNLICFTINSPLHAIMLSLLDILRNRSLNIWTSWFWNSFVNIQIRNCFQIMRNSSIIIWARGSNYWHTPK